MRCDVAAVRLMMVVLSCVAPNVVTAQQPSTKPVMASAAPAYDALLEGMSCKQQKSGRLDCEFKVGSSTRFVIAGVGQEDVSIGMLQADATSEFVASVVPLHGCVVVKPARAAEATLAAGLKPADSASMFAFVSPKTGKVYRTWSACLTATRPDQSRADAVRADSSKSAAATKAPATRPPR